MTGHELDALRDYLRQVAITTRRTPEPDGSYRDAAGDYSHEASEAPRIAREWCRELLTAAEADGLGGCRLCCQ